MTNLESILKSRDVTLPTKVCLTKAMVFPVVMYGCESWKAKRWRIDGFELWCWRRLLRVPWTTRWSNESILKESSPGCSLEGLMLKLKLQYFVHLKSQLIGKDPDAGKVWGQEEKGMTEDEMVGWHHWLNGHEFEWTPGVGDGQGGLACCSPWGRRESGMTEGLKWTVRSKMGHASLLSSSSLVLCLSTLAFDSSTFLTAFPFLLISYWGSLTDNDPVAAPLCLVG